MPKRKPTNDGDRPKKKRKKSDRLPPPTVTPGPARVQFSLPSGYSSETSFVTISIAKNNDNYQDYDWSKKILITSNENSDAIPIDDCTDTITIDLEPNTNYKIRYALFVGDGWSNDSYAERFKTSKEESSSSNDNDKEMESSESKEESSSSNDNDEEIESIESECLEHTCLRNFLTHCITTSDWYSDNKIFQEPHDLSKRKIIHIIDQFTGHTIPEEEEEDEEDEEEEESEDEKEGDSSSDEDKEESEDEDKGDSSSSEEKDDNKGGKNTDELEYVETQVSKATCFCSPFIDSDIKEPYKPEESTAVTNLPCCKNLVHSKCLLRVKNSRNPVCPLCQKDIDYSRIPDLEKLTNPVLRCKGVPIPEDKESQKKKIKKEKEMKDTQKQLDEKKKKLIASHRNPTDNHTRYYTKKQTATLLTIAKKGTFTKEVMRKLDVETSLLFKGRTETALNEKVRRLREKWEFKSRFNSNPKFVGVFQQRNKRYRAQIEHNGKTKSKRNFSSREAAARWFDEQRKKLNKNKDGLILNFPRNGRNDTKAKRRGSKRRNSDEPDQMENTGKQWSQEEDEKLFKLARKYGTRSFFAQINITNRLGRKWGACRARLKRLKYDFQANAPQRRGKYKRRRK